MIAFDRFRVLGACLEYTALETRARFVVLYKAYRKITTFFFVWENLKYTATPSFGVPRV